jgi:hypothetical protein
MKKSIKTLLILLTATYAISCGNSTSNDHDDENHDKHHEKAEDKHEDKAAAEDEFTLDLNNGKQWQANIETTEGIGQMVILMDSFTDTESVEAYSVLSNHLTATLNTILKECTMDGEAHNHLHTYIYPMFEMIEGIGSTDLKTCKYNYKKLNMQLSEYPNYFE